MLTRLIAEIPTDMKRKLRHITIMNETTIRSVVIDIISNYISTYEDINGKIKLR